MAGQLQSPIHTEFLAELLSAERKIYLNGDELTHRDLIRNKCHKFSKKFSERFGLKLQRGWFVVNDYPHEHWWCEDDNGNVIDPTAMQFFYAEGRYSKYEDREFKALIGACPNCGGSIYEGDEDHGGVCSEECVVSYRAYLMSYR